MGGGRPVPCAGVAWVCRPILTALIWLAVAVSAAAQPPSASPISDYTVGLVEGVSEHRQAIDRLLAEYSDGWTLQRMPGVDRAILRVGLYELLFSPDIPDAVAIDEAVELAKALSTDESPKFVNGLLGRALRDQLPAGG